MVQASEIRDARRQTRGVVVVLTKHVVEHVRLDARLQRDVRADQHDFDALYAAGATAIFPPGTVIADSAIKMLEVLDGDDGAKTAAE